MAQEVLVALARRAQQVGPPHRQHPRPVRGVVRIGHRELQCARSQLRRDVVGDLLPGGAGLVGDVEAGPVELRIERAPPHRRSGRKHVHRVAAGEPAAAQRAGQRVRPITVVTPLIGVHVPVRGTRHLARWPRPVGAHRHRRPPGDRPALLLADVVRPAAAVAPHRARQQDQRQHRTIGGVAVEPLADACAHDDHRPPTRFLGVAGELLGDPNGLRGSHSGDRLLPGRGVGVVGVVVPAWPIARQSGTRHAVLSQHQIEHRAHPVFPDPTHRDPARQRLAVSVESIEARQRNQCRLTLAAPSGRHRQSRRQLTEIEIPLADAGVSVAEAQRAVRNRQRVRRTIEQNRLECGVLLVRLCIEIGRRQHLARHRHTVALLELDQEWQVRVLPHVVNEERNPLSDEEFREHNMTHRHGQRPIGTRRTRHPLVGELGVVGVVRADTDDLGAAVAHLGHPMRIGRAGHRHVGAPHHQIRRIPPVTGLRHVGLVAEDLRRGHGQVGIPVVERRHHPTEQLDEPRTGGERHHRHRRDG